MSCNTFVLFLLCFGFPCCHLQPLEVIDVGVYQSTVDAPSASSISSMLDQVVPPANFLQSSDEVLMERLKQHIVYLADTIGVRNIEHEESYQKLNQAASYIETKLKEMGLIPKSHIYEAIFDKNKFRNEKDSIEYKVLKFSMSNIEVVFEGLNPIKETIVIGAHYDTVSGSPGADDNASSVAALLEIARAMAVEKGKNRHTLKLVFFPNEECPYSKDQITKKSFGPNMGSVVYAKHAKQHNEKINMIALESIGYFSDEPNSQSFPKLPWRYVRNLPAWLLKNIGGFSDVANDIHFIGNWSSRKFLQICSAAFNRAQEPFPTKTFYPPEWLVRDIGRSDHKSFWLSGYPAIMITDTANLRNPHYHKETDTSDHVNYEKLTKLVRNLIIMTKELAELKNE